MLILKHLRGIVYEGAGLLQGMTGSHILGGQASFRGGEPRNEQTTMSMRRLVSARACCYLDPGMAVDSWYRMSLFIPLAAAALARFSPASSLSASAR